MKLSLSHPDESGHETVDGVEYFEVSLRGVHVETEQGEHVFENYEVGAGEA